MRSYRLGVGLHDAASYIKEHIVTLRLHCRRNGLNKNWRFELVRPFGVRSSAVMPTSDLRTVHLTLSAFTMLSDA